MPHPGVLSVLRRTAGLLDGLDHAAAALRRHRPIHLAVENPQGDGFHLLRVGDQVTLEVVEADPVVKGQTAASSYKPAKLENGVRVMVPPFVEAGERIVVDTNELTYLRRGD